MQILDPNNACASWTAGGTVLAPTLTCVAAGPVVAGAPVCQITANGFNSLTLNAAGAVSLAAVCSQGTDNTTQYAWTASTTGTGLLASTQGDTGKTQANINVTTTTTFTVTPTTGTLTGNPASVIVTINAAGGGGGAGGDLFPVNGCGAPYTKTLTKAFEWTAAGNMLLDTVNIGGMGNYGALVATFVTPAAQGTDVTLSVSYAEYPGSTGHANRTVNVSRTACDFNATNMGAMGPSTNNIKFALGTSTWGFPSLLPNTRYYVNISNTYKGQNTCAAASCDLRLEIVKPAGF